MISGSAEIMYNFDRRNMYIKIFKDVKSLIQCSHCPKKFIFKHTLLFHLRNNHSTKKMKMPKDIIRYVVCFILHYFYFIKINYINYIHLHLIFNLNSQAPNKKTISCISKSIVALKKNGPQCNNTKINRILFKSQWL